MVIEKTSTSHFFFFKLFKYMPSKKKLKNDDSFGLMVFITYMYIFLLVGSFFVYKPNSKRATVEEVRKRLKNEIEIMDRLMKELAVVQEKLMKELAVLQERGVSSDDLYELAMDEYFLKTAIEEKQNEVEAMRAYLYTIYAE